MPGRSPSVRSTSCRNSNSGCSTAASGRLGKRWCCRGVDRPTESGAGVAQVEAAVAMLKKLRLPEYAAPDARPGRDLPAFQLGALPNPQLQRHYQARPVHSPSAAGANPNCNPTP